VRFKLTMLFHFFVFYCGDVSKEVLHNLASNFR